MPKGISSPTHWSAPASVLLQTAAANADLQLHSLGVYKGMMSQDFKLSMLARPCKQGLNMPELVGIGDTFAQQTPAVHLLQRSGRPDVVAAAATRVHNAAWCIPLCLHSALAQLLGGQLLRLGCPGCEEQLCPSTYARPGACPLLRSLYLTRLSSLPASPVA